MEGYNMGFHSPAMTFESSVFETGVGFAVLEPAIKKSQGDLLLILVDGHTQFARLMGQALITEDGESIEGEALEDVEVSGKAIAFINKVMDEDSPI